MVTEILSVLVIVIVAFTVSLIFAMCIMIIAAALYPNSKRWLNELKSQVFQDYADYQNYMGRQPLQLGERWMLQRKILFSKPPESCLDIVRNFIVNSFLKLLKRILDVVSGLIWALIFFPEIVIVLIGTQGYSRGKKRCPVLRKTKIYGYRDKPFYIYRFINTGESKNAWNRMISRNGLNRLFLFIPLLRGDVTLFGLSITRFEEVSEKHSLCYNMEKPGLINLASVLNCRTENEKYCCDEFYLGHQSPLFNFRLAMSVFVVNYRFHLKSQEDKTIITKEKKEEVAEINSDVNTTYEKIMVLKRISINSCPFCGGKLPEIQGMEFCPFCGMDISSDKVEPAHRLK